MKSLLEILNLSSRYLEERGIPNSRREAEEVVSFALNCKRLDLYLHFDQPLSEEELRRCRTYLERRGKREPIQYINGEVEFFDCRFKVDPTVLIPRPETELLVDKIVRSVDGEKTLWDIGCGSGCIGIAIKKRLPHLEVVLSDVVDPVRARENAALNGVDVEFVVGDLFAPFKGRTCDILVSNPPYISEQEFTTLEPEVADHEPIRALVSGKSGLEFYERFALEMVDYLKCGGRAYFEIGHQQGAALMKIFSDPPWTSPKVEPDWASCDRFFSLEKQS